jgi:cytochrome d ubiquinol oxidase subunit II
MLDYDTLKFIWWVLVIVLFIGFALTDGFDMGVGALLPFLGKNDNQRRVMINVLAPHWDGNQVWFILAAGAIFAAWPPVYATAFSGFYLAFLLVLFSLFFRPVGFDYRSKLDSPRWRNAWDWGLFIGSAVPAFLFGVAIGNFFLGFPFQLDEMARAHFEVSFFSLLHPFALLCGVMGLAMLILHGAAYLQLRAEEPVRSRAANAAQKTSMLLIAVFTLAGAWLYFGIDALEILKLPPLDSAARPLDKLVEHGGNWTANYSRLPWMTSAPVVAYLGMLLALLSSRAGRGGMCFVGSSMVVIGIICTAAFSLFPFILPSSTNPVSSLTIWDATSSHYTLNLMFWAAMIFVPIILGYTSWAYKVMWGSYSEKDIEDNKHTLY